MKYLGLFFACGMTIAPVFGGASSCCSYGWDGICRRPQIDIINPPPGRLESKAFRYRRQLAGPREILLIGPKDKTNPVGKIIIDAEGNSILVLHDTAIKGGVEFFKVESVLGPPDSTVVDSPSFSLFSNKGEAIKIRMQFTADKLTAYKVSTMDSTGPWTVLKMVTGK